MRMLLHAPDLLRHGRQIDIHIRSTAPYSAARETTTSVGLVHARPNKFQSVCATQTHNLNAPSHFGPYSEAEGSQASA